MKSKVTCIPVGELETNCYIIEGEDKQCIVVDPGAESIKLVKIIQDLELVVKGVLITHCHFDHIGAAGLVAKKFEVDIFAQSQEAEKMMNPEENLSIYFDNKPIEIEATQQLEDGQLVDFGHGLKFKCLEVPGHTENSLCFYHEDGFVLTGDTLFNEGIGRTDLYSGSPTDLVYNIKRILFALPIHTIAYPGHGLATTIGKEMQSKYF
jgi:hydroxyacylglutathione hydrolase